MNKLLLAASAAVCVAAPSVASAAVYVGSYSVGGGTLQLSITTDDTTGVLSQSNITDFSFTMSNAGGTVTMNSANAANTYFSGTALSATATDLYFDFSGIGHIQWDQFGNGFSNAFCLDTPGAAFTCIGSPPSINIYVNGSLDYSQPQGSYLLGSVAGAIPEPGAWAMLILGFLGIGSAMRRARRPRVALRYA